MGERTLRTAQTIITASMLVRSFTVVGSPTGAELEGPGELKEAVAQGSQMIDNAIQVQSQGWNGMSEDEREKFIRFFDPGNTGELDDKFVQSVQGKFERIGSRLQSNLDIKFTTNSEMCQGMRLFYTDFLRVYVCPFMETETRDARVARDLVHEVAHMALLSVDRAYYYENFKPYQELTPRGHWATRLPFVGHLLREIAQADTEFHPDAYSHFAAALLEPEGSAGNLIIETVEPNRDLNVRDGWADF